MLEYIYYENFVRYLNANSVLKIYRNSIIDIATNSITVDSGSILRRSLNDKWVEITQKDTSAMGIEKWLMELGCKYNNKNKIRNRSISDFSQDEVMYDEMYDYVCKKVISILKSYEGLEIKDSKGEYQSFEEAIISGSGDLEYKLNHYLSCTFNIVSSIYNYGKVINLSITDDTEEKQLEEEIVIALSEFVYKMKLPRLNLNKIYGNFGSEVECLLSPFVAGKLIHESTNYCSKNSFLESSNYINDILNQKERNKDINESITDGLYIDDWEFINIDKDGSFYIKAKDVLVIKNKAVIGIIDNVEFLGYKYKFLSSISQVGTEFKSYKDVCKIEDKKIVKVNYEAPSVLCKLDILI